MVLAPRLERPHRQKIPFLTSALLPDAREDPANSAAGILPQDWLQSFARAVCWALWLSTHSWTFAAIAASGLIAPWETAFASMAALFSTAPDIASSTPPRNCASRAYVGVDPEARISSRIAVEMRLRSAVMSLKGAT